MQFIKYYYITWQLWEWGNMRIEKTKVPWGSQIKCSRTCLNNTFVISSFVALKCFAQEAAKLSGRNHFISAITKALLYAASVLAIATYCHWKLNLKKNNKNQWCKARLRIFISELKHDTLKPKNSWLSWNHPVFSFLKNCQFNLSSQVFFFRFHFHCSRYVMFSLWDHIWNESVALYYSQSKELHLKVL